MATQPDDGFYPRSGAHIDLANGQLTHTADRGQVSASMMYATARFCAFSGAASFKSSEEMLKVREQAVGYFVEQFRLMLEENYEDYARNFEKYGRA